METERRERMGVEAALSQTRQCFLRGPTSNLGTTCKLGLNTKKVKGNGLRVLLRRTFLPRKGRAGLTRATLSPSSPDLHPASFFHGQLNVNLMRDRQAQNPET